MALKKVATHKTLYIDDSFIDVWSGKEFLKNFKNLCGWVPVFLLIFHLLEEKGNALTFQQYFVPTVLPQQMGQNVGVWRDEWMHACMELKIMNTKKSALF